MATTPVPGYAMALLAAQEVGGFGVSPTPAASQIVEAIEASLGVAEVGVIRPKRDRTPGRGMTNQYFEGRQSPIDWSVQASLRVRATNVTVPQEDPFYLASGLQRAIGGSDITYTPGANPLAGLNSLTLARAFGRAQDANAFEAEWLAGCVARSVEWRGGDQELTASFQGQGARKSTLGAIDSITVNAVQTTFTFSTEESYRLTPGYYQCESEIILLTVYQGGGTVATITRGALGSTAAAHTAQPLYPYFPVWTANTRPPIGEAQSTVTIGGVTTRCTSFQVQMTTGLDLLPAETGSKFSQGYKVVRYDLKGRCSLIMKGDDVRLLGRARERPNTPLVLTQGTGAGGVATFNLPFAEIEAPSVAAPANETISLDVGFRVRDDANGNNAFSLVLS